MQNRRPVEFNYLIPVSLALALLATAHFLKGFRFGILALSYCPSMHQLHEKFISHEIFEMPAKLLLAKHSALEKSHALVGLSVK